MMVLSSQLLRSKAGIILDSCSSLMHQVKCTTISPQLHSLPLFHSVPKPHHFLNDRNHPPNQSPHFYLCCSQHSNQRTPFKNVSQFMSYPCPRHFTGSPITRANTNAFAVTSKPWHEWAPRDLAVLPIAPSCTGQSSLLRVWAPVVHFSLERSSLWRS